MSSLVRVLSFALAAAVTLGCGRNRVETAVDPDAPTVLVVDNQAFPDMTIYVVEGARRVRLGLAGGLSQTKFTLPKYLVRSLTSVRFQADPIGSARAPISDEITVSPGDEVTLRIPPS
ncbi:MAG: hypothetical protein FJ206_01665 [Gemmatimonadetes bacterium]|nr:hypothetical protein [Gemmatimonadota bacterium]